MARTYARLRGLLFSLALAATAVAARSDAPIQFSGKQRLESALGGIQPQRPGVVDAYVIVAALDSDPVFGREAREAGRVLARRFDAQGRTIVLAEDEGQDRADAPATPYHLAIALNRAASLMDRKEDALVLYTTSHGTPRSGLNFKTASGQQGVVTPAQLAALLAQNGFENRLVILQACYSGQFVPALAAPRTIVATAASAMQPSFGCSPGNDWTFFGHALINQAMRKPDAFPRQFRRALVTVLGWERRLGIEPSSPQLSIGSDSAGWLSALEARAPRSQTMPVGRPPSELAN